MPAANNLQDGNLADKQGPTGKRLSTCSHRTMSNPATCVPRLQRKRHCDHLISDLPAAAPEKLVQKKKKKQMKTSILSNFIPWSSFWGDRNSEKSAPGWSELWSLLWETNQNITHSPRRLCSSNKNHSSSCTHLLKRWEEPKWTFTTGYWIIQILPTLQYIQRAGNILCHEQMSTVRARLLQKRKIYHYPQILSWKALFLLTFTTWRVFPKWNQVMLFKNNISFSYFSLSASNTHYNGPRPQASQFTPTAQALQQQKFWGSVVPKQPWTRTYLQRGLGKRGCPCSSIRRKGRSKHKHSPIACFPAQSPSPRRTHLLLWTLSLSVEPDQGWSWLHIQTTSNSPVTVLGVDGH